MIIRVKQNPLIFDFVCKSKFGNTFSKGIILCNLQIIHVKIFLRF